MDREQQRQNRRSSIAGVSGAALTPLSNPSGRPTPACDPASTPPAPFTPSSLTACPPPAPIPLNLPEGLIVPSSTAVAYCPSTAGYSVTGTTAVSLTAGDQLQTVIFTAITGISDNQLNYLYAIVPSSSADIIAYSLSGATSSVINITHLNYTQSEELINSIQDAKFNVDTLAVEKARNLLICQAENSIQVAACPTSAFSGSSALVPPGMQYVPSATVAPGTVLVPFYLSPTSGGQTAFNLINIAGLTAAAAEADALAAAQAESLLRCVFANSATSAACCTSEAPGNNLGFTYCVPATGPSIPGSATAVGYFTVNADTVFSSVSKTEADAVAREVSRNALNCYFPSTGMTATCVSLGLTAPFAPTSTTSVYMPVGSVILSDLDSSTTAADEQALLIAQASLNCFWSNAGVTAFCPPSGTFTAINNFEYNLDASPTASLHYSSFIPEDTVISYESQSDADAQALSLATANLSCVYCNDAIPPTCSGGINETVGTTSGIICNVLAEIAQNTAVSLGNILVSSSSGGINCCYGNDPVNNTIFCGTGAFRDGSATATFTSSDSFFLPANIITVCESTSGPTAPASFFSYSNLWATDNIEIGCCSDVELCSAATGSATALPTLWAQQTSLFSAFPVGATFYSDSEGTTPYAFPAAATYVVSRASTPRFYRGITGSTGYTQGLTACDSCGDLYAYTFRGATLGSYASASTTAAVADIFCGGPTAQTITLYTDSLNPFNSTSTPTSWYEDICGNTAFTPVSTGGTAARYIAGYVFGSTGYYINFSASGGNTALFVDTYALGSCPLSRYSYAVYVNAEGCSTASGATTLYTSVEDAFTANGASTINFYTEIFNDASVYSYPSGTGYISYEAPDTSLYSRPITGSSAYASALCTDLFKVTVQYSNDSAEDVCFYPNFYSPTADGYFNNNIRTVWSTLAAPFSDGSTAKFYTGAVPSTALEFKPGASASGTNVYLSEFSPGDKFRAAYRQYTHGDTVAILQSYTGAFAGSPFIQSNTGASGTDALWKHTSSNICADGPSGKSMFHSGETACKSGYVYSDIKYALSSTAALNVTKKYLPRGGAGGDILYSVQNNLLFDGFGYVLATGITGTVGGTAVTLTDLTRVGAGFTGAVIRTATNHLGSTAATPSEVIPTYISGINYTSGVITLGGYYDKVNSTIPSNTDLYVTGFRVEASGWTGSQFTCGGPLCDKLEVGHSIYSYYVGAEGVTSSAGYINRISGNTVYYSGAPSFNNFSSYDIGTGASHGSGNIYIMGRQLARFWEDDNQATALDKSLPLTPNSYIYKDETITYAGAKDLVLGTTGGATATFTVIGVPIFSVCPYTFNLPVTVQTSIYWNGGTLQYYYDDVTYKCDGTYDTVANIVAHTEIPLLTSCCETAFTAGGTAISACNYYATYPSTTTDPTLSALQLHMLEAPGGTFYYDATAHTPYAISSAGAVIIQPDNTGPFVNAAVLAGEIMSSWPCNAADIGSTATYSREYVGYFDSDLGTYPIDEGATLDNINYWAGDGKNNIGAGTTGYVFKEFDPAVTAGTGCNCGNFIPIQHGLTSGVKYSIWPSATDAWAGLTFAPYLNPSDPFQTAFAFNQCATGCDPIYTCLDITGCDEGAPGAMMSGIGEFSAFDFSMMPDVAGTAEDLKAEATEIAQNIVNSFVRCFYINDYRTGDPCSNPDDYTVQIGYTKAGEVVSNISLDDANQRAQDIANSRTICMNPDVIGAGCENTVINGSSASFGGINTTLTLSFSKEGCNFTPTMSVDSQLQLVTGTIKKITICGSDGSSQDIYVPDIGPGYTDLAFEFAAEYPPP